MVSFRRAIAWWGVLVALGWLVCLERAFLYGEEGAAEKKPSQAQASKPKQTKNPYHRLPPYYAQVVKPEQRKQIYAIQEQYGPKIDALRAQLEALLQERDKKIEEVLTEAQRQEVERLREEAKAKRATKEKSTAVESKPAAEPAQSQTPEKSTVPEKSQPTEKP
ncbi:MAG TPA: hypothetical protein PK777_07270 [Thermoguttaceae bacterium]|nr:hypothetical protein [Thermoguttaceae bacterium]